MLESQDDLVSSAAPVTIAPGASWERFGITCTATTVAVSCSNGHGHGFTVSPGHLHLF